MHIHCVQVCGAGCLNSAFAHLLLFLLLFVQVKALDPDFR